MMEYKYINIDGYGILVDESAEISSGDICLIDNYVGGSTGYEIKPCIKSDKKNGEYLFNAIDHSFTTGRAVKIAFAEKQLNLSVTILPNWREWDLNKLTEAWLEKSFKDYWIDPNTGEDFDDNYKAKHVVDYLVSFSDRRVGFIAGYKANTESISKHPSYIVIEETITNSDGKPEGVIKEIIW